jgi:hypothetical protein
MARKSSFGSNRLSRPATSCPRVELLEDRCVPDASGLMLAPGQNVFQYANAVLQNLEAYRIQANAAITALDTQQINQMTQKLNSASQVAQALLDQVVLDKAQFNSDVSNGASIQTQVADLAKIQADGLAAGAGVSLIAQYRQAVIQQTAQQLQADAQLRFAVDRMIFQQETGFLNQLLPALIAAGQANVNVNPQVGSPLFGGQQEQYSGSFSSSQNVGGATILTTTTINVTVIVSLNNVTLSGPASETIVVSLPEFGTVTSTTNSTAGAINGSLLNPNQTAAAGTFTFTLPSGTVTSPWSGFVGTDLFVGQITNPATGVASSFVLTPVQP